MPAAWSINNTDFLTTIKNIPSALILILVAPRFCVLRSNRGIFVVGTCFVFKFVPPMHPDQTQTSGRFPPKSTIRILIIMTVITISNIKLLHRGFIFKCVEENCPKIASLFLNTQKARFVAKSVIVLGWATKKESLH